MTKILPIDTVIMLHNKLGALTARNPLRKLDTGLIFQDKFSLILFPFLYVAFKQHFVNNHDKHSWVFDTQY